MADIIERIQEFEQKYGQQLAGWAIITMIVYLVVAQ